MSVTFPPRPTSSSEPGDRAELGALVRALIEEARQRARRRRRRYAGAALLIAGGIGSAAVIFSWSGGPAATSLFAPAPGAPTGAHAPRTALRVRNGPLTVIDGNGILAINSHGHRRLLFRCREYLGPRYCTIIGSIAWSPRGDELLFDATTGPGGFLTSFAGMHVLDLATGKMRHAGSGGFSPVWSRDGRIALVKPASWPRPVGSIAIRRIVGSHVTDRWLATGTDGHDSSPSWSPDGEQLVFATRLNGESTISIIDADGSDRHLLARHAASPAWSPDGILIAYRTSCGVKFVTPSGRDATPVGHSSCLGRSLGVRGVPGWSPDGRRIAISTRIRAFLGGYDIYVVSRDGTYKSNTGATSSSALGLGAPVAWQPIPRAR